MNFYQIGGSLANTSLSYVKRQADDTLYYSLKSGDICYVLNCRQMGKSSLRIKTKTRLETDDYHCITVDLQEIGICDDEKEWLCSIIDILVSSCESLSQFDLDDWLDKNISLSPGLLLSKFIEQVLLAYIEHNLVIFIDEIDYVRSLPFSTDNFFGVIRACYNKRGEKDKEYYQRLTFAFFGVATPTDLINDPILTPFNVGKAIALQGLSFEEADKVLTKGFEVHNFTNPSQILREILFWTGGQPFLTQKLCHLVVTYGDKSQPNVKQIVEEYILKNWESQDNPIHLKNIQNRILFKSDIRSSILVIYQNILQGKKVILNNSLNQAELLLSGLVVAENNKLRVYNQIYQHIFNLDWVQKQLYHLLSQQRPEFYAQKISDWITSNFRDNGCLLSKQELVAIQEWASSDKPLNKEDLQFLYTSVQQIEQKTQQKEKQAYKIISGLMGLLVVGITSFLGWEWYQLKQEYQQQLATKLVNHAASESEENLQRSILLETEALKRNPSVALDTKFYQKLALLPQLKQELSHEDQVNAIAFNPETNRLLTGGLDGIAKLWGRDGRLVKTFPHNNSITAVAFSPNGKFFITASLDGIAKLWSSDGRLIKTIKHDGSVNEVVFSFDNQYVATASMDQTVEVVEITTGKSILSLVHQGNILTLEFSPHSQYLVTGSLDGMVQVWDVAKQESIAKLQSNSGVNNVTFSPDSQFIAIATGDITTIIWEFASNETRTIRHKSSIYSVAFSPDGEYIAIASGDYTATLWDFNQVWQSKIDKPKYILKHHDKVNLVNFSADSKYLLTGSDDKTAKVWEVLSGNLIKQMSHEAAVIAATFINQEQIVTASWDQTVRIWDRFAKIALAIPFESEIIDLAFTDDNNYVATIVDENKIQIWNLSQGSLRSSVVTTNIRQINDI